MTPGPTLGEPALEVTDQELEPQFSGTERFELRGRIGQGGMGVVFRVLDREVGKEVALKTLLRPGAEQLYRVKREFRSRAGLSHPNLLELYDLFVEGDQCFFTMELLHATDFMSWVRGTVAIDRTINTGEVPLAVWEEDDETSTMTVDQSEALRTALITGMAVGNSMVGQVRSRKAEAISSEGADRLRSALKQLIRGLQALHEFGTVHRDVKPSNVLVTETGRVVLLDFGVALEREHGDEPDSSGSFSSSDSGSGTRRNEIVGTVAYMSPEQALGEEVSGATDFYAVGVMLYQALTGTVPFTGSVAEVFRAKLDQQPIPPQRLTPGVPEDLSRMAMELLASDPETRPNASELLARLEGRVVEIGDSQTSMSGGRRIVTALPFVGRESELDQLDRAYQAVVRESRLIEVHVHGLSGIGKSMLLRRFVGPLRGRPGTLVLRSRCDPQESVPYNAFDAAIDALARHLANLSREAANEFVPDNAHALIRVFPVLGRVAALAEAPAPKFVPDVYEQRRQAFDALRELLVKLAAHQHVVLWLDDLHWGDRDSVPLLEALTSSERVPALMLLLSYRSEDSAASPLLDYLTQTKLQRLAAQDELDEPLDPPAVIDLPIRPLDAGEVEALAQRVFEARGETANEASEREAQVRAIVEQSGGNPFIVHEFARYLAERESASAASEQLDWVSIVRSRLDELSPGEQVLLELLAIAGRPIERNSILRASGLAEGGRTRLTTLREALLLRSISSDHLAGAGSSGVSLALYHDRVRQAVLQGLSAEVLPLRHRALAESLEQAQSDDLESLAFHFAAAGKEFRERAADYALRAGDRAMAALAFGRASELYRDALELLAGVPARQAERPGLLRKLGDALGHLGRLPEAAQRYSEAAELLGGRVTVNADVRELRLRAAEHYMKAGLLGEGWRVMREVLEAFDIRPPSSATQAMLGATWRRGRFVLRKLDVDKPALPISPEEQARLDVLWTASTSLSMVNHTLSDAFRTMHLGDVVRYGSPSARCRALAYEVAMETHIGGPLERSVKRLLDQCEHLARKTGDPYDDAWRLLAVATYEFTHGRWKACVEACEASDRTFRALPIGTSWERSTVAVYHWFSLAWLGELGELRRRLDEFVTDAELREDVFGLVEAYTGQPVLAWLAADEVELARDSAEAGLQRQGSAGATRWPENSYRRQNYCDLMALTHVELYRDQPVQAWVSVLAQWKDMQSAFFVALRTVGLEIRFARARAALGVAEQFGRDREKTRGLLYAHGVELAEEWTREKLLADVREQVKVCRKDPNRFGEPMADLLEAGVAQLEGRSGEARTLLERAVRGFDAVDMALHRECARYALGQVIGHDAGVAMQERASEWMAGQGVKRPRKMAASQAVGFGLG